VPADRLALAVRVGGEVEVVGGLGGPGDRIDVLLVLLDRLVAHGEPVVRIHRALLRHQVADMAVAGEDGEVLAEVFVDRLGLGGRFDDEQVLGHVVQLPVAR
jgi:Flp pilus assembly protein CpaB